MSRRKRRDGNHGTLTDAFLQAGCSVADLSGAGIPGWPDIVVGCVGRNHLVELKNPDTAYGRAGLNPNQQAFARTWRGGPIHQAATLDDVIGLVAQWRTEASR